MISFAEFSGAEPLVTADIVIQVMTSVPPTLTHAINSHEFLREVESFDAGLYYELDGRYLEIKLSSGLGKSLIADDSGSDASDSDASDSDASDPEDFGGGR
jgi:hypothetical protein